MAQLWRRAWTLIRRRKGLATIANPGRPVQPYGETMAAATASSRTASRLAEPCDVDLTEESRHRDRRPTAELEAAGAGAMEVRWY